MKKVYDILKAIPIIYGNGFFALLNKDGMKHIRSLDDHIEEMKNIADHLVEYTFPMVDLQESKEIDCLKQRSIFVDGYSIGVHFSRVDFGEYYFEKLELVSVNTPFLPMFLVCKIGAKFLGSNGLRLTKQYASNRRIYTWDVKVDKTGRPLPSSEETENFEGFVFSYNKSLIN